MKRVHTYVINKTLGLLEWQVRMCVHTCMCVLCACVKRHVHRVAVTFVEWPIQYVCTYVHSACGNWLCVNVDGKRTRKGEWLVVIDVHATLCLWQLSEEVLCIAGSEVAVSQTSVASTSSQGTPTCLAMGALGLHWQICCLVMLCSLLLPSLKILQNFLATVYMDSFSASKHLQLEWMACYECIRCNWFQKWKLCVGCWLPKRSCCNPYHPVMHDACYE